MLRYYRAFDFHADISKQQLLIQLALQTKGEKELYAFKQMDPSKIKLTPQLSSALDKVLDDCKGKIEFVELVSSFKVAKRTPELLSLALEYPDSLVGRESVKSLLDWGRTDLLEGVLKSKKKEEVQALVKALWPYMYNTRVMAWMERIMRDSTQDLANRKLAVRTFGGPWESEDRLLALAKDNKIPVDLHMAAAGVFQTAWRQNIRAEGSKYVKLPGSKEGEPLPNISLLIEKTGEAEKGRVVFKTLCSNCHQINGRGVKFGPDLSEIGSKLSKEAVYTSILYPDQGISFGYEGYRFKLKDGTEAFGMIASETADKIDIRYMSTGQTLSKNNVVSRVKLESSLMPSNLQSTMSQQELVDLVEYLGTLKKSSSVP